MSRTFTIELEKPRNHTLKPRMKTIATFGPLSQLRGSIVIVSKPSHQPPTLGLMLPKYLPEQALIGKNSKAAYLRP